MEKELVIVIDFGGQYNQLVADQPLRVRMEQSLLGQP